LQTLRSRCEVGTNLLDINLWAQSMITEAGARSCYVDYEPSFGRGPFGHYICTSVNDAVLHGLPYDYTLANGDLLTLDLAVSKGGVVADSAISVIVGDSNPPESVAMISATQRALCAGIAAAGPGARIKTNQSTTTGHFRGRALRDTPSCDGARRWSGRWCPGRVPFTSRPAAPAASATTTRFTPIRIDYAT
jgi:methionine aminopeptidase